MHIVLVFNLNSKLPYNESFNKEKLSHIYPNI